MFAKLRPLVVAACPFVNLPETQEGRWGARLIAEDMKKCVWVTADSSGAIWSGRKARICVGRKFTGLRENGKALNVTKGGSGEA